MTTRKVILIGIAGLIVLALCCGVVSCVSL